MSEKSDLIKDDSDKLGCDSGSSGTYSFCAFPLLAGEYVADVFGSDSGSSGTYSFFAFPLHV